MKERLFKELLASVKEGGAILRGEKTPSRTFDMSISDVKEIKKHYLYDANTQN